MEFEEGLANPDSVASPIASDGEGEVPIIIAARDDGGGEPPQKKTVTKAAKYASADEFQGHGLELRGKVLWCKVCDKEVTCSRRALVRQHIWGYQGPTAAQKAELAAGRGQPTTHMKIVLMRSKAKNIGIEAFFAPSSAVPAAALNRRAQVARAFLSAGIPLNVLENPLVVEVLESAPAPLGGRKGVSNAVGPVTLQEFAHYRDLLKDWPVSLCFDGSMVNHPLEVTVVRFISDKNKICKLAIGAKRVEASLNAASLAHVLRVHMERVGISLANVHCAVADRGDPNAAAVQQLLGPEDVREHTFKLSGCLAHSLDNAGKKMQAKLTVANRFGTAFKRLKKSFVARQEFASIAGEALPSYSATRWWSWHHFMVQLLRLWSHIGAFVRKLKDRHVCEASVETLHAILTEDGGKTRFTLELELFVLNAVAESFINANPIMQAESFVAPYVFQVLQGINTGRTTWWRGHGTQEINNRVDTLLRTYQRADERRERGSPMMYPWVNDAVFVQSVKTHCDDAVRELHGYFATRFWNNGAPLQPEVQEFKAMQIFCPFYLKQRMDSAADNQCWAIVEPLMCLPDVAKLLGQMCEQYVNFKVILDDWLVNNLQKVPIMDRALQSWSFWAHVEQAGAGCRAWWTAASYVALRLPSSCTAERFFSVAGGTTKKTQASLLDENQEIRHLLAFNNRTTMCDDHDLV
jgi:hypothetical protein